MKNNALILVFGGLIVVLTTSCSQKVLLRSNFNAHNVGFAPIKSIPNEITGDSILYESFVAPRLKIVTIPLSGNVKEHKELEFKNILITGTNPSGPPKTWLGFKAISTDFATGITFNWLIRIEQLSGNFYMDLQDGQLNFITRTLIDKDGNIRVPNAQYDWDCKRIVGKITDASKYHFFTIKVDAKTNKYQFSVSSTGIQNSNSDQSNSLILVKNLPTFDNLLEKEGAKQVYPKPVIYFNWDSQNSTGRCLFNNVSISKP